MSHSALLGGQLRRVVPLRGEFGREVLLRRRDLCYLRVGVALGVFPAAEHVEDEEENEDGAEGAADADTGFRSCAKS